jgi:hypothetical protein
VLSTSLPLQGSYSIPDVIFESNPVSLFEGIGFRLDAEYAVHLSRYLTGVDEPHHVSVHCTDLTRLPHALRITSFVCEEKCVKLLFKVFKLQRQHQEKLINNGSL